MKATREKTENRQVFLTIEMEPAEVEKSMAVAYRHLGERAVVPGFRKGKAPRAILERYLRKESVLDEALNHMVTEAYEQALKEQELEPFARPNIEITQTEPTVIFKATVPLKPTVELGDYKSVRVPPEPVDFSEDKVNAMLEALRHEQATWEPVERPVAYNDMVVLNVESNVEGKPFFDRQVTQYHVVEGTRIPVTGFAEQLVGMKKTEEKEFKLKLPDDYPNKELAGKEGSFKVKASEIKEEKLPELNDELAKRIDPELTTVDMLRERLATNLKRQAEEKARMDYEDKAIEAVVSLSKVEYPPILVEAEIERLLEEQARSFQRSGVDLDKYLKAINKTPEQLREEMRPVAEKRVIRSLVLDKLAEETKTEISDSEINTEVEAIVKGSGPKEGEMQKLMDIPQSRESVKNYLTRRKTIAQLVDIAKGSEPDKTEVKEATK